MTSSGHWAEHDTVQSLNSLSLWLPTSMHMWLAFQGEQCIIISGVFSEMYMYRQRIYGQHSLCITASYSANQTIECMVDKLIVNDGVQITSRTKLLLQGHF